MEGLKECEANLVVHLHPSKAGRASEALLGELSSLLFTHSEALDGVVLAYDPNICSNVAKILSGLHPYFGVRLKVRLLLFNPKPNMLLEGEVIKVTPHSIHAVVLGFSAAVIGGEEIREELKHTSKHGKQIFASQSYRKHKIKVGTILRFLVKSFDEEVLHISGSLMVERTGCARWLDKNTDYWSQTDSTLRKRKVVEEDEMLMRERLTVNKKVLGEVEHPMEDKLMVNDEKTSLKTGKQIAKSKKRRNDHT